MKTAVAALGVLCVCTGIATAAVSVGAFIPGWTPYTTDIAAFNTGTGKTHAIILFYRGFDNTAADNTYLLEQCRDERAVPYVNVKCGTWSYSSIISGSHDTYLRTMAQAFRDFGDRILMGIDSEMNNDHKDVSTFIQMWRHVHGIFSGEGASNIEWVWSPNYLPADYSSYYPGDAYVHWVGTEGFSWKNASSTASSLFGSILNDFASRYPHKPAIISYTAADANTASAKASWISNAYGTFTAFPNLKAVVWWNDSVDTDDFRVYQTSYKPNPVPGQVTTAYRNAVSPATYLSTLPPYSELTDGDGGDASVSFTLTPSPVSRGSTLTLNWTLSSVTQAIDAYLGAVAPDGTLFVADADLAWSTDIRPIARGYNPGGTASGILQFPVPGSIAAGVYTLEAVIVPAGSAAGDSSNWLGGMFSLPLTVR